MASLFVLYSCFSFALINEPSALERSAVSQNLFNHPTWAALLHSVDGVTQINDPSFILSGSNFTLQNELIKTIQLLETNPDASCRFPARRQFILSALNKNQSLIPAASCQPYLTFKNKAPAEDISLVYATENITQPSSMMGHIMLKISGTNNKGIFVEHGVSYFTELNSFNIPLIIWESLITGKNGYFQLSPFQQSLNHYLNNEQRNIWEYEIDFSPEQAELFHNHLWELKTTKLKYFFNSYNCATFTKMLLRVGNANKVKMNDQWLSPIDVVKSTNKADMVTTSKLIPSSKWQLRMLSSVLAPEKIENLITLVDSGEKINLANEENKDIYLSSLISKTYNTYQYTNGMYDIDRWKTNNLTISESMPTLSNEFSLDLSQYKSPLKTPDDSQVSMGYKHFDEQNWLNFKYLPASHGIEDDNRQFFSENELKLMEFSILANQDSGEIKLDSWTLYSAKSYIPWNPLTGGTSGHFSIGAEQQWNDRLSPSLAGKIYGGVGYTYPLTKDLNTYAMLNLGLAGSSMGGYIYGAPEVGIYLYEVFNMKTFISYQQIYNQQKSKYTQNLISLNHSVFNLNHWSILIEYQERWNTSHANTQYGAHLKYQF